MRIIAEHFLLHSKHLSQLGPVFGEAFAEFEHGEFGKIFVING